jgi:hypothetical protein
MTLDPWRTVKSTPFSACKLPYGTTLLELVTSGRSVEISSALVGQPSAAKATDAPADGAVTNRTKKIAERKIVASGVCDIPGLFLAGRRMNEPRPGPPGPKVSFASLLRWGTEPEGWYVDLPYAVFLVGVSYSAWERRRSNRGANFVSI